MTKHKHNLNCLETIGVDLTCRRTGEVAEPEITASMLTAMKQIAEYETELRGRMGEALVHRGLAKAHIERSSAYPVHHYSEGRWGRVRRDYQTVSYSITEAGKKILAKHGATPRKI